jgi:phytoene dehydrogenase-like protein
MTIPYHLTIIGTRFPHLALGVLLAKRGGKVLIVDTLGNVSGHDSSSPSGYRFRRRPVPLFGMDDHGFLRRFLNEIGIGRMLVKKAYSANPVSYQVVLPRHRINVYPDRKRLLAELAQEFPTRVNLFKELYGQWDSVASKWYAGLDDLQALEKGWLHAGGYFRRFRNLLRVNRFKDHLPGLDPGPEADFFNLQNYFLGAHDPSPGLPVLSTALIQSIGRRGTFRENMGSFDLGTLMIQRFQEYGGEVKNKVGVTSIETPSKKGFMLALTDGSRVRTQSVATTEGIAAGIPELSDKRRFDRNRGQPPRYPVRFYIGLDERFVPVGMENDLFLLREADGGPMGFGSLYLALGPSASEAAPKGKRALTVTALTTEERLNSLAGESVSAITEDILEALEAVIPFLSDGLDYVSSDLEPGSDLKTPRPIGSGITAWNPDIMSRMRIRTRHRGKIVIMSPTPWELGIEGEALMALTASGILRKVFGQEI